LISQISSKINKGFKEEEGREGSLFLAKKKDFYDINLGYFL